MSEIEVVAEELRTHANSIETCSGVIDMAQGASDYIQLGDQAYGILCQWIPPILAGRQTEMSSLLTLAKSNLDTFSGLLRSAADLFENTDDLNSWDLTEAGLPIEDGADI